MERRLAGVGNTVTDIAARIRALEQQVAELRAQSTHNLSFPLMQGANMKIRMVVEYDNDAKIDPSDTAIVEKMLEQEKQYWIHHGLDINYALAVGGTVTFELVK